MKIIIHRGATEIGGNCIELSYGGKSILLDLGMPLNSAIPTIPETLDKDKMSALIVSHTHQDHIGLADMLSDVPVYIGSDSLNIAREASVWINNSVRLPNAIVFSQYKPFIVAGFTITPYPVDHSAFGSYALLIEAGGKRVFYSGDFRDNGYAAYKTKRLIEQPPENIDVLLMEGTTVGSLSHDNKKEETLIDEICQSGKECGLIMLAASCQNIDRMVTAYKAANRLKRYFVIDAYGYSMLKATGISSILGALNNIKVFIHHRQRVKIKDEGLFDKLCPPSQRVYMEELTVSPEKYMVLYRYAHRFCFTDEMLKNALMIYSMWKGYLEEDKSLIEWLNQKNIRLEHIHTSGHADIKTLKKFAEVMNPKKLIPIHSENPEIFATLFNNVLITDKINLEEA